MSATSELQKLLSSNTADLETKKQATLAALRTELATANAQQLVQNMNEKCFAACIKSPGSSLSGAEQTCLDRCFDRFMDAYNITSKTYVARISKERALESTKPLA